jgi:hypothetical protein
MIHQSKMISQQIIELSKKSIKLIKWELNLFLKSKIILEIIKRLKIQKKKKELLNIYKMKISKS